jgi:hypothetical protein
MECVYFTINCWAYLAGQACNVVQVATSGSGCSWAATGNYFCLSILSCVMSYHFSIYLKTEVIVPHFFQLLV